MSHDYHVLAALSCFPAAALGFLTAIQYLPILLREVLDLRAALLPRIIEPHIAQLFWNSFED